MRRGAPRHRRRRRGDRGIPPGLSQLHRELHGQPARSGGDPRPQPREAWTRRARARARQFPATAGWRVPEGRRRGRRDAVGGRQVFSQRDAQALPAYYAMLERVASVLRGMLRATPVNFGDGLAFDVAAVLDLVKAAKGFRALSLAERRDIVELFTKSAGDLLDRWFESAPIKAAFGFDAVVGNFASPYTPGSGYVLLHHVFGEVNGKRGQWGHAVGGMGAITQAMAVECKARGVVIQTNASVARRARQARSGGRRRARVRRRDRGRSRGRQRQPEAAVRKARGPGALARRLPRAHRGLSLRFRDVPHEPRTVGAP